MKSTILIKDESISGEINHQMEFEVEQKHLSVRELIQKRVYQEVENYNQKLPDYFHGLVQPTNAEEVLNGFRIRDRRKIDPEKQFYIALDAFQKNGFFILINNRQVTDLETQIQLNKTVEISFLKLTPLVGG